jgi:general secretion pathway protein C
MALDQLLRRNFWVVTLGLTGLAAFFGARGLAGVLGGLVMPDDKALSQPPLVPKVVPMTSAEHSQHATSAEAILARNPFDSQTGPLNKVAITSDQPMPAVDMTDPENLPPCDGVKVLVIAASSNPDWSFAALSTPSDPKSVLRRRGGEFGGKVVEAVGWNRVVFKNSGQFCQVELLRPQGLTPVAPPPVAPPIGAAAGGAPGIDPAISKGIVRVSATEFNVDRGVVDKILENQAELMKTARIVPEQENGKVVGIRLFGVRNDTLLGVLGMENGDRLETINGFDMTSPEKALEAYARLRTADHLTIKVNRRGAPTNLDYNIK